MPKKHANIIILVVSDLFAPGALVNIVKMNLKADLLQEHFLLEFQVFSLSLIENMCNGDFLNIGI